MAEFDRRYATAARSRAGAGVETLDQGLRAFMLGIYNNMALGLAVTGAGGLRRFVACGRQWQPDGVRRRRFTSAR